MEARRDLGKRQARLIRFDEGDMGRHGRALTRRDQDRHGTGRNCRRHEGEAIELGAGEGREQIARLHGTGIERQSGYAERVAAARLHDLGVAADEIIQQQGAFLRSPTAPPAPAE